MYENKQMEEHAKSEILLIAEKQYKEQLAKLFEDMKKEGYFRNIPFYFKIISFPGFYKGVSQDKKIYSKYRNKPFECVPPAVACREEHPRILFFNAFFVWSKIDEEQRKIKLLHEIGHHLIYKFEPHPKLYKELKKREHHEINYILKLPDEIKIEKWFYRNWPDLFSKRMQFYLEGDIWYIKNISQINIQNLQAIINRILFIKSIYSFYNGESKQLHLTIIKKYEEWIKNILTHQRIDSTFLFQYIKKILSESLKRKINEEKLIELYLSYKKDFKEKIIEKIR